MSEHQIGEVWIDNIDGLQVMVINDPDKTGCKACAYATQAGGACPMTVYERHPCCSSDRQNGHDVYYKLVAYMPEAKAPPFIFNPFGATHPLNISKQ